jgi:hypothetical protein
MDSENTESTKKTTEHLESHNSSEKSGRDISAQTIGRMMGLATVQDLTLMESKIDLMATKVSNLTVRMEKVLSTLANAPTGADLERIDVHIGALRTLIKEVLGEKLDDSGAAKPGAKGGRPATKIISSSVTAPDGTEPEKDS